jgi:hypothetical protein
MRDASDGVEIDGHPKLLETPWNVGAPLYIANIWLANSEARLASLATLSIDLRFAQ